MQLLLEEVFKTNGEPTVTFVEPTAFPDLIVAIRTPGRGVVVEGPSGIGKTTAVKKALEHLNLAETARVCSVRKRKDRLFVQSLPDLEDFGTVIIDDFHLLDSDTKSELAQMLKVLADEESTTSKLVLVGINRAGEALIQHADDVTHRLSVIKLEVESSERIRSLIKNGEDAFNVQISASEKIAEHAQGSFYLAQLLCQKACLIAKLDSRPDTLTSVDVPYLGIKKDLMGELERRFWDRVRTFARGTKFQANGRAAYFHVLKWLSESQNWTIDLREEIPRHKNERYSVGQIVDKGYLKSFCDRDAFRQILHFDKDTRCLTIEDPQLYFYLQNLEWQTLARKVGFTRAEYLQPYDVALSFAGENRVYAEALFESLEDLGHAVFYDMNEQHRLLANDVESVLGPIYENESRLVVAVLGSAYGQKRWPLFEKSCYEGRLKKHQVVPVWDQTIPESPFDSSYGVGLLKFDPAGDMSLQALDHAKAISLALVEQMHNDQNDMATA